jgi:hypothetical protein
MFLALAFEKQWAESERRLKQIESGPIAKQLEDRSSSRGTSSGSRVLAVSSATDRSGR